MDNRLLIFKPYLQESYQTSILQNHLFIPLNEGPLADKIRNREEPDFGYNRSNYRKKSLVDYLNLNSRSLTDNLNHQEEERKTLRQVVPGYKYRY